jgi:hypothetical protein
LGRESTRGVERTGHREFLPEKQCVGSRLTRKTILQMEDFLEGKRDRDTETETERARERDYKDGK